MTPGHIRTRSHSFTPKLSSRLAGFGGEKGQRGGGRPCRGARGEGQGRGVAFTFHFGGAAQSKALPPTLAPPSPRRVPATAPPHIISLLREPSNTLRHPSSVNGADGKRASQIVYATGFVNRLITAALADPRALKAFRMEVRGTKLVLHKPPSDRAAGVRDFFPAGVVEDEGETLTVDDAGGAQRRDVGCMGRKKRCGRHPALSVAGAGAAKLRGAFSDEQAEGGLRGHIAKGSFEVLMHELVFATVFLRAGADEEEVAQRAEQWRDYASAILFFRCSWAGRAPGRSS
ncbi:hypothetical protein C8R47DRAFT_1157321 [Mycena vitilis]|nr:hypothetical protein C8R47DRAFT_1157321 [Mycena vitilis]